MRDRLEELDRDRGVDDETDYLGLLPRLLEWQRWLLIHALELLAGPGAVFRFRTVLLLVARQNGKSTLLTVLILWRLYQDGARMVLETHASLDHAKKAWEEAVLVAEAIPELADEIAKKQEGKGSELLRLDGRETFKIASANRRGGRGFSGDLIIFDELREHQDWKSWSATSKTTMARKRAQVWGVSNAGDASSVVLRHLRAVALAGINGTALEGIPEEFTQDLELDSVGLFEWSAGTIEGTEDGTPRSVWDRDGWAQANPSMGYTDLNERAIANAALNDPEWEFRTEVLCQFVNMAGSGPFPNGAWIGTRELRVSRDVNRPACYGLAMSYDRKMVSIALAFWDTEGRRRVEIAAHRAGTDWVLPWLRSGDRKVKAEYVAFQAKGGPMSSMAETFTNEEMPFHRWEGSELAAWTGAFYDLVRRGAPDDIEEAEVTLTHGDQPVLDIAANTARIKALGAAWVIDLQNSPEDAAPLEAAIAAVGLLDTNPEPTTSVYETRGLRTL